jgi:hypothetical protein
MSKRRAEIESAVVVVYESVVAGPHCGHRSVERVPHNASHIRYDCKDCGTRMVPAARDCCAFCSYGTVPCPSVQCERAAARRLA